MRILSPLRIPAADATTQVLLIAGTFARLLLMVFVGRSMSSRSGTPCMKSKNGRDPNPACTAGYTHMPPKGGREKDRSDVLKRRTGEVDHHHNQREFSNTLPTLAEETC